MGLKLSNHRSLFRRRQQESDDPSWWLDDGETIEEFAPVEEQEPVPEVGLAPGPAERSLNSGIVRAMNLEYRDARAMYRALVVQRKKKERTKAKSTFVPRPGTRDAAEYAIERYRNLEGRLLEFMESFPE